MTYKKKSYDKNSKTLRFLLLRKQLKLHIDDIF